MGVTAARARVDGDKTRRKSVKHRCCQNDCCRPLRRKMRVTTARGKLRQNPPKKLMVYARVNPLWTLVGERWKGPQLGHVNRLSGWTKWCSSF